MNDELVAVFSGICKSLVADRDGVSVWIKPTANGRLLYIECSDGDHGKLIGHGGVTARAFHCLARVMRQGGPDLKVCIVTPDKTPPKERAMLPFVKNLDWDDREFFELLESTAAALLMFSHTVGRELHGPALFNYSVKMSAGDEPVERLTAPLQQWFDQRTGDKREMTALTAVEHLFRAIAKNSGSSVSVVFST